LESRLRLFSALQNIFPGTFVAHAPQVEDFILPQSEDVEKAVRNL